MLRKWGMFVLMLLATPALVLAQNTGKISGVVTDADTGDSIPGAQVVVVGTTLGAITDVDGNYFIIGVPVGAYDVQARFVGYQESTVAGVQVSSGYTQEINFALREGVELGEIVVEYERPLIQKDAVGVPKIVDSEEIVNLPVRGAAAVASIQAGVVSEEGSGTLNVRGGRGSEVTYYIDGVKVVGTAALPQSAVQEQEMIIGNISARYGDAMSGIINITTKSGSPNFFGSVEGVTSESLDDFGYNLASLALGGPVVGENLNFFFAAEYLDQADSGPRAAGQLRVSDATLDDLRAAPTSLRALDGDGNQVLIPVPASLGETYLPVDSHGDIVIGADNTIVAGDGTVINVPAGVDASSINPDMVLSSDYLPESAFSVDKLKRKNNYSRLALNGNLNFNVMDNIRMRVGARYVTSENQGMSSWAIFSPEDANVNTNRDMQFFTTWTHYLSNSTFYQLQFDYTDRTGDGCDERFECSIESALFQGDISQDAWATTRGYKNLAFETVQIGVDDHGTADPADDTPIMGQRPTYSYRWQDGRFPTSETAGRLVFTAGGNGPNGYSEFHNTQMRFQAMATTQIGLHQLEFGGEFEQQTRRSYGISGYSLHRFYDDTTTDPYSPGPEGVSNENLDEAVTSFDQLSWEQLEGVVGYTGYNFRGSEVDTENLDAFVNDIGGDEAYNIAPHKPIYYGGYIQDKLEFRDIVLNAGIRVDVFDNNTRTLYDRYSRLALERVSDVGGTHPGNIGADFVPYYSAGNINGYRDRGGNWYDANGQAVGAGDILLTGAKPNAKSGKVTEEAFVDYEPEVTVMPRIGVSFPVTDQALFFARYGKVAQRPSNSSFTSLAGMSRSTGRISNNALQPEKTTEYEIGFRQRLTTRSALTISGFFRQISDLIQLDDLRDAFPQGYSTYGNKDFGTVKGFEFDFDLRRTNNVAAKVNYTMSFAQGTGSSSTSTSLIVWIDETPPNFISPLDFDQRHTLNVSLDYRLGKGEGPEFGGTKLLENFGVNVLLTASSGQPFTPQVEAFSQIESKAPVPAGGVNSARMPWSNRIDMRVDRKFSVGERSTLSAFLWVQNLTDRQNVQGVWDFTGLPDDDGFLATSGGQQFLSSSVPVAETLYRHRNRNLGNYGIPRLTRIGVRLDF
jgi:outer membrane receptor protein involved in Fe transport